MKILSIAVPCYHSAAYMGRCIDTLLKGGEDVEILIVNDGSFRDETGKIADEYEKKHPTICKAIHKENGGHGDAVYEGLKAASGVFFKVVDSDDWVDYDSYMKILEKLRYFANQSETVLDMMISNFVYEKEGAENKKVMSYKKVLPIDQVIGWKDIGRFLPGQYILMHSVIYRRELLLECDLRLPKHTFYVDNIFVYYPLPHVKTLYYMDVNFYRYHIGREDQSVNEEVMIGRIDQQLTVTKLMLDYYNPYKIENRKLRRYMILYLEIMMVICSILAIKSGTEENLKKKKEIWRHLRKHNPKLFLRIRWGFLGQSVNLFGKAGRSVSIMGYKIAQKFYGFN
ncbi:MAG: glycosyltransferase family 2 protein [Johnsonella sp.]|nr:glycosyltransferase family 2 protein [Johnsonella sp.]